jgi:hypothetical protein
VIGSELQYYHRSSPSDCCHKKQLKKIGFLPLYTILVPGTSIVSHFGRGLMGLISLFESILIISGSYENGLKTDRLRLLILSLQTNTIIGNGEKSASFQFRVLHRIGKMRSQHRYYGFR